MNVFLLRTPKFSDWLEHETLKSRAQVEDRLFRIQEFGHFGLAKDLGNGLAELKWQNGRRVYFSVSFDLDRKLIILILGGNKNGQSKDIRKARKILEKVKV